MTRLSVYRGEIKTWACAATNAGSPVDLTGAAIYFAVRANYPAGTVTSDVDASIALSTATSGITPVVPASGTFEITVTKANTNTLTPGIYLYGIEAVLVGMTDPVILDSGEFEILSDVVRAI